MVMARLTPRISISIVSRLGWLLERPPALVESVKLLDSLSRFIAWQRSLADPLEQGENPGHVSGEGSSLFAVGRQTRGQKDTLGGHIVWNLYGICMEFVWNLYGTCMEQHANNTVPPPCPQRAKDQTSSWSLKNRSIASLRPDSMDSSNRRRWREDMGVKARARATLLSICSSRGMPTLARLTGRDSAYVNSFSTDAAPINCSWAHTFLAMPPFCLRGAPGGKSRSKLPAPIGVAFIPPGASAMRARPALSAICVQSKSCRSRAVRSAAGSA